MNNSQQQRDFRYIPFDKTSLFQYLIQPPANFQNVTCLTSQLASPRMSPPQQHDARTFFWVNDNSK